MSKRLSVLVSSVAAVAALCTAGAARAADVAWSVGIGLPGVGAVISNGPTYGSPYAATYATTYAPSYRQRYVDEPVYGGSYYVPAPVYAPVPVYVQPRVVYRPAPVVYAPVPIVEYERPVYRERARAVPYRVWAPPVRYRHGHGHDHHHDRDRDDRD